MTRSSRMPWYDGPTVLGYLESVDDTSLEVGEDFRFPVQSVVRPQSAVQAPWAAAAPQVDGDYRGYAGQVAAGRISVGEEVVVLPAGCTRRSPGSTPPTARSTSRWPASPSCCGSTATSTSPAARS